MQQYFSILKRKHEQSTFQKFAHELLNDIEIGNTELPVEAGFTAHIESFIYLGSFQDQQGKNLHILDVSLKTNTKLEQARTMQRNLIARYLKDHWLDGALVAFHNDNSSSWRLSFVKIEYKYDDKGKPTEELTPARRYSFLVGENEPSHTAQTQLAKIYEQTSQNPTLAQLEEAFGVERVTKEFFEKYRELFESVVAELKSNHTFQNEAERNNIDTESFAKKLLGQIVFLYFLQKKGWLGVPKGESWGDGDKMFLRNIYNQAISENKNFFNNYLEVLFYDTLNNPRNDKVDRNYSDFFQSKIPFLNGGLFDPQYDYANSLIYLENKLFDKILGVFDTYNFTVKEDEPLEKEVAVDPEMLGKVFENLIEENLRKGKGTYYTPREIVHYMCQESLINYLKTEIQGIDETISDLVKFGEFDPKESPRIVVLGLENYQKLDYALKKVKVVDPACGSGAFLVGMLQEIVKVRADIDLSFNVNSTEYQLKKETIQNCIYGVDIDPGAIEIAKLRLWLSLVVDYDLEEIEPLPNLDYKLMVGNSLIEKLDTSITSGVLDAERVKLIDAFKESKELYFSESGSKKKGLFREQINEIIRAIVNYDTEKEKELIWQKILGKKNQMNLFVENEDQQSFADVSGYTKQLEQLKDFKHTDHFEWHLNFNEVFENGGFDIVISNPPYITYRGKEVVDISDADVKRLISLYPDSAEYKVNSYALFTERGVNLLKKNGTLSYIIPGTILQNEYLRKIRKYLITKYHISQIVSFANKVFEAVTDSIILQVNNNHSGELKTIAIRKNDLDFSNLDDLKTYNTEKWNDEENDFVINLKTNESEDKIISKIEDGSIFLGSFLEINIGIKRADAPIVSIPKNGYKKFLVGRNINKFVLKFPNSYILFDKSLFHTGIDENIFKEKEKILVRKTGNKLIAALDSEQYYTDQSIYNLYSKKGKTANLKIIIALLNSPMLEYYFNKKMITNPDVFPYIKGIHLKKIPIKFPKNHLEEKQFETLVEKIIECKKENKDTSAYEKQIDQLVYKLYDLRPEEIKIVEMKK